MLNKTTGSVRSFQNQLKHTQNNINSFKEKVSSGFGVITKKIAGIAAGVGIAEVAKQSIELASNLAEVQNVVDTTFGNSSKQIDDWSQKALKAFGLSQLQAKKFNGTMGALLKSSGVTGSGLTGMSEGLVGLAGDFASFYNLDPEESFDKIKSGISGETEPLKALGINMSVANLQAFALTQGIKKQYKEMSQAEQVQLRYNYLMSVSKDAQGDFNKTSSSFANQLRIAKTNLQQLGATIGGYVLPYLNKLFNGFNSVFDTIPKIIQGIKNFFTQIKGASSAGDLFNPIMEKIDDLLFRFLPRSLANFFSSTIGSALSFLTDIYDNTVRIAGQLIKPFKRAFEAVKGFVFKVVEDITPIFDSFIKNSTPVIKTFFDDIRDRLAGLLDMITKIFNFLSENWPAIQIILVGIGTAIASYKIAETVISVIEGIKKIKAAIEVVKALFKAGNIFASIFKLPPQVLIAIAIITAIAMIAYVVYKNWKPISNFFKNLWAEIKNTVVGAFDAVVNGVKNTFNSIVSAIKSNPLFITMEAIFKGILATIIIVFNSAWTYLVNVWNNIYNSVAPVLTSIKDTITSAFTSVYNTVSSVLSYIWNVITTVWNNIYNTVAPIISGFIDDVMNGFNSVYNGITSIFQDIKDTIVSIFNDIWGVVKGVINGGIDMVNSFIGGVNGAIAKANKIPGINISTVPNIPKLAKGAVIKHGNGGILANIGEGSKDEVVAPLDKINNLVNTGNTNGNGNKAFKGSGVNVFITIQGNVVGNEDFINQVGTTVASKVLIALNNM